MNDYVPIACAEHERLEFAVLRRQKLHLTFRDEGGRTIACLALPTDVATREGAEWLSFLDDRGIGQVIRLDRIESVCPEDSLQVGSPCLNGSRKVPHSG